MGRRNALPYKEGTGRAGKQACSALAARVK
jgi:hypothetical protein